MKEIINLNYKDFTLINLLYLVWLVGNRISLPKDNISIYLCEINCCIKQQ